MSGYLTGSNKKKGSPWPKVFMATVAGLFVGMDCDEEKLRLQLMCLPGSPFHEAVERIHLRNNEGLQLTDSSQVLTESLDHFSVPQKPSDFLVELMKGLTLVLPNKKMNLYRRP